jgi:CHASE2 domain-containing sensor protein/class 3 adenylate cyclase
MIPRFDFPRRLVVGALAMALMVALALIVVRRTPAFSHGVELPLYDQFTQLTWPWKTGHPDVVLVTIRDKTRWPLTDRQLTEAIKRIELGEPVVIGIDLIRDDYRGGSDADSEELRRIVLSSEYENIVMAFGLGGSGGPEHEPPPFLREADLDENFLLFHAGLASFPLDGATNQKVRRGYIAIDEGARFSLAALCASHYLGRHSPDIPLAGELQRIGSLSQDAGGYARPRDRSNEDAGNLFLLKFGPALDAYYDDVSRDIPLESLTSKTAGELRELFQGKVVLLGTHDASTAKDEIPVIGHPGLRGVRLLALATAQIIREIKDQEPPIRTSPQWLEDLLVVVFALISTMLLLLRSSRSAWISAACVIAGPALALALGAICLRAGCWVPVGAPAGAALFAGLGTLLLVFRFQRREIDAAYQLFERKFGPERARLMWKHRETILAGGTIPSASFEGTILFSDLAGSTPASRELEAIGGAEAFSDWNGAYIDRMTSIIIEHGAFVVAFLGDGLMVPFGYPPRDDDDHPIAAVRCSLAMHTAIDELNRELPANHPRYRVRIGIYTGPIQGSQRGAGRQFDYSLSGAAVNLAKRLEEFDKAGFMASTETTRILVSQRTRDLLDPDIAVEPVSDSPVTIDPHTPPETIWKIRKPS